jgi:two-component sensor histidine kinase
MRSKYRTLRGRVSFHVCVKSTAQPGAGPQFRCRAPISPEQQRTRATISSKLSYFYLLLSCLFVLALGAYPGEVGATCLAVSPLSVDFAPLLSKIPFLAILIGAKPSNDTIRDTSSSDTTSRSPCTTIPRLIELEDRLLRRIGAELHNGPAQLIGLALLQLGGLSSASTDANKHESSVGTIRASLQQAMQEIRTLSSGLAPDFEKYSVAEIIQFAVHNHEDRTGTSVALNLTNVAASLPVTLNCCLYRFVQEGLRNAVSYAGGAKQEVLATFKDEILQVEVIDQGPGFTPGSMDDGQHFGLYGMRRRVEALGGEFEIDSLRGAGTRIISRFRVNGRVTFDD